MKDNIYTEYLAGEYAFLDTFLGLIPCRVLEVFDDSHGNISTPSKIKTIITENKFSYTKGEIVEHSATRVIPKDRINTSGWNIKINTGFVWKKSKIDIDK